MRLSIAAATLLALPALAAPAQDNYGKEKTVTVTITQCPKNTSQAGYPTSSKGVSQSTPKSSAQSSSIPTASASTTSSSSSVTGEYPTATATSTWTGKGLQELAKKAGKVYLGTAADIPGTAEENDPYYLQQLGNARDFGQITPANMMKPFATEPERNVFNYTGGQVVIDFAHSHGQINRCHTLVWHNQLPEWLTSQTWDNSTLISIMTNHITQIVKHWGKSCYAWDVVNEAFNDDGTLRSSIWSDTIGPEFLPIAFKAAAAAAPKEVKLYYNDYNIESPGAKSTAAQNLIKTLKARGIRIDGAGLQSHFVIGKTPSQADQESNMAAFAALGVDVAITELDVRAETLPVSLKAQAQQKKDFYSSAKACVNTKRCVGVTLWDFVDQYSWIPYTFAGQGYGTPWLKVPSGKLVKKIAYDGIAEALSGK